MAELGWGAGGIQEAIVSRGQLQEQQEQAELFPGALEEQRLTIQQKTIANASSKIALEQQTKELALLDSAIKGGKFAGAGPADELMTLAQIDLSAGNLTDASTNISKADSVLKNAADIATKNTELQNKLWGDVSNVVANVHNEADWQRAKQIITLSHPELLTDPANRDGYQQILSAPYSPQLVDMLTGLAQNRLQAAEAKRADAATRKDEADANLVPLRAKLLEAQAKAAEALANRRYSAGAGWMNPKAADVKVITDLMKSDFDDPADLDQSADFDNMAQGVAERMLSLEHSGIPRSQASRQAYAEAKNDGVFGGLKTRGPIGKPSTKVQPLPMPADNKFQANQWYSYNGGSWLFKGGDFADPKNWSQ